MDLSFNQNLTNNIKFYILANENEERHDISKYFRTNGLSYRRLTLKNNLSEIKSSDSSIILVDDEKVNFINKSDEIKDVIKKNGISLLSYTFDKKRRVSKESESIMHHMNLPLQLDHFHDVVFLNRDKSNKNTEIKNLDEYIAENKKFVQLGELAGSLIHDINNYITVCKTSLEGIKIISARDGDIKKINKFSEIGLNSLDDLTNLSRKYYSLLQGGNGFEITPFNLHEFTQWLMDFFAKDIAVYHIDVQINVPRNIEIRADRSVFLQSLLNLVKNSVYAIKDQDNPQIRIDFGFRRQVSQLLISDSGHMPLSARRNAFKKNFTTKGKDGTGFGLFMIKTELEKMNFKIELDQSEHTCFRIEFPNESIGIKNNLV